MSALMADRRPQKYSALLRVRISPRSILAITIMIFSILSPFASHILGVSLIPVIRPASGALGPNNNLGIDCGLGSSADAPNPFPTPITTKDSDGVIDTNCQWAGDVDADPAGTLDPLASDSPEASSPQLGGGLIANVVFTNMNATINGFDMTVTYDPHILDFVTVDQSGLTFGGNVGCPTTSPQCTLTLASSADRTAGSVRLAQVLESITIGPGGSTGSLSSVTLFRLRFNVVGAGFTAIHFGQNIITFANGTSTGPDPHFAIDGSFSTQDIFNLLNAQPLAPSSAWFNVSWSIFPSPELPGNPLTFTATASCSFCQGTLTYNWDFSSVDSSTYVPKTDATGSTVTITAPPPLVNRVTLTVTNGTANVSATRLLPLAASAPSLSLPVGVVGSVIQGRWLGGIPTYSGSYNLCPAQSSADNSVCSKPNVVIPLGTQSQNKTVTLSYNYGGAYNSSLTITDSAPSQVNGPSSVATTFLVNITGAPAAFTITTTSNSSTVKAGQAVQFLSAIAYNSNYPALLRSNTFTYTFSFGDGASELLSSGLTATVTHRYLSAGNFTVGVTAQETRIVPASKSRIQENGFLRLGGNQTLSASFTFSPASPQVGQQVSFTALVSGGTPPYSMTWSFGDGTTVNGNTATHVYTKSGIYPVTLNVTDSRNNIASTGRLVVVSPVAGGMPIVGVWSNACGNFNITNVSCPSLNLTADHQLIVQINITSAPDFNAFDLALYYDPHFLTALSTDVNGSTGIPTVFGSKALALKSDVSKPGTIYLSVVGLGSAAVFTGGNGVLANIVFNITSSGVSPLALAAGMIPSGFAQDGNGQKPDWTVLANTNSLGQTYYVAVGTADGYFSNVVGTGARGPIARFTFNPAMPTQGGRVTFYASQSFDPDNSTGIGIKLYLWDFGDGGSEVTNQTVILHDYSINGSPAVGNFTVRLTVIDIDNNFEGMQVQRLTISSAPLDKPPVASFTFSPITPIIGQLVTFNATGSFDPDGTVVMYTWNFGDGATFSEAFAITSHTYQTSGNFAVTLTIQDNAGLLGSQTQSIHVALRVGIPPVATFTFTPPNPAVGQSVSFDGSGSFDPDGTVTSWFWSFGDGQAGFGAFPTHTYFSQGNFTVTLTVTDTEQLSNSITMILSVHSIPTHDVMLDSVTPQTTRIVSTQTIFITVELENTGSSNSIVNITTYWDSHVAGSLNNVFIPANFGGFRQFFFVSVRWDTTGVPIGNHTITARIFLADDPTPADNFGSGGQVTILPPPILKLVPSSGTIGTKVVIQGSGFPQPQFSFFGPDLIQVTFDNMTTGFITTATGSFNFTFDVPVSQPGIHYINVLDEFSGAHASAAFQVLPTPGSLIVTVKTAAIYFPGDTATIFVLPSLNGAQPDPSRVQLQLTLLRPNGSTVSLALILTPSGLYKATYIIPKTGSLGTYTAIATVRMTGASDGSSITSFEVKPTWLSSNAQNIAGGATVAGVIGLTAVAWRKGYLRRNDNDDLGPEFLNSPERSNE